MKEKASFKENGEDQIPRVDPDAPGLAPGEELAIDPGGGDEIDPIRKWWDETEATSREKARNRRLEELEAGAEGILDAEGRPLPRRRKKIEPPVIEVEDIPGLSAPKEISDPVIDDESPLRPLIGAESGADSRNEADGLSLEGFSVTPLKRHAREEGEPDEFDLTELFGSKSGEPVSGEAMPGGTDREDQASSGDCENDKKFDLAGSSAVVSVETVVIGPRYEDPGFDPGDLLKPLAETEESALHFEFPDFEDEFSAPLAKADISLSASPYGETEVSSDESGKFELASITTGPKAGSEPVREAVEMAAAPEKIVVPVTDDAFEAKNRDLVEGNGMKKIPEAKTGDLQAEASDDVADVSPADAKEGIPAAGLADARKKAGCWTVFATLFFFAALLLIALIGVAGWFAWSRLGDFETELSSRVRADLGEKGVFLDYGDWVYRFPRGLVFDEVTIFDDATRQRPLVRASAVGLNVDLLALAKTPGEFSAGEINFQDSSLSLFEAGDLVTTIEGVDGEIFASQESIRVDRISALLGGWQVTLRGIVTLPQETADPGESIAPALDAKAPSAPVVLDFSAFKALEPWLALGDSGGKAPALNLAFAMDADQPDLAAIEGTILGREVIWHGVDIASVTATFNVVPETGELSVPSFQIGYGQGFIGGRLAIDTATQRLRIDQVQSTVDVLALLGQYKPAWVEKWKSIRLVDAPSLQMTGEVPFEDPAQADLKVRYDHRQGLVLALEKGDLPLRDLRGNFTVNRGSIETNDAAFELFGGSVMLNGATRLTDESRPFNGLVEITGLAMEKAAAFFGKTESGMSGRLSFVFRGVGYSDMPKIRGGGTLRVEEAVIPGFPVLGEIQDYVGRAVPAFGVKGQGNIVGSYIIESGVLVASDLTVANTAARIVTNGSVNLSSYETEYTTRAELDSALAAATGLTDKAITFAGKGPLSDPAVTLKAFPIEFASASLGNILGTSPRSLETLRIVPGVEEAVGAFADELGEPGITIHPEVIMFFKTLLGEEATAPEAPAEPQAE